jgi:hypothetical protein
VPEEYVFMDDLLGVRKVEIGSVQVPKPLSKQTKARDLDSTSEAKTMSLARDSH